MTQANPALKLSPERRKALRGFRRIQRALEAQLELLSEVREGAPDYAYFSSEAHRAILAATYRLRDASRGIERFESREAQDAHEDALSRAEARRELEEKAAAGDVHAQHALEHLRMREVAA